MVQSLPERDQISQSYEQLIAMLAMAMGGRVAEEMVFGKDKVTSGAAERHPAGDQDRPRDGDAARLLREARHGHVWREPGRGVPRLFHGPPAEHFGSDRQDDRREVRRLVHEAHETATRILTERRADLETLAKGLMEFETLSRRRDRRPAAGRAAGARVAPTRSRRRRRAPPCRRPASRAPLAPTPAASRRSRRPESASTPAPYGNRGRALSAGRLLI